VAGYPATFYPAVARAGVAVATVITLGSAPVFAGLLAWATGQGRPSARWGAATGTAVLGCGLLVLGPAVAGHGGQAGGTGIVLAMLAGLCYASYSLIGRTLIAAGHPAGPVMGAMFGAAALLALRERLPGVSWYGLAVLALGLAFLTVPARRRGRPGTGRRGSP
jgi:drug/metabolite transporter, DME family